MDQFVTRATALIGTLATAVVGFAFLGSHALDSQPQLLGGPRGNPPATRLQEAAASRPNIVMVMVDDMRADDLRFMPRVRRLIGERGLVFRNSFSPYPLCCPARASFLTGQYPHNHGVLSNVQPWGFGGFDDRRTLATSLRAAGYRTAFVGKYLNEYGKVRSRATGRSSLHYVPPGWTDWYATLDLPAGSSLGGGTYHYFDTVFNINGRVDNDHRGQYQTNILGRFARRLATRYASSDRPFFLYLSPLAPHTGFPVEPDDHFEARGPGGRLGRLATPARPKRVRGLFDRAVTRSPGIPVDGGSPELDVTDKPAFLRLPPIEPSEERALLHLTRQRAEALHVVDVEVARLVARLRREGVLDETVLMFTSDNGYFAGEHRFRFAKTLSYEPSLRVPLLIAGPGIPSGVRFEPAMTVQLTATVLDLADARPPHRADGRSLVPAFTRDRGWVAPVVTEGLVDQAPRSPRTRASGFTDARNVIGIRTARYQYVRWSGGAVELYDLLVDPNELVNVAHDARYRLAARRLARVWWRFKNCAGTDCFRPMAAPLTRGPRALRTLTRTEASGVRGRFGLSW